MAQFAAVQHDAVGRRQLLRCGVPRYAIGEDLRSQRLVAAFTGSYYVGHSKPRFITRGMASVLACGEHAWSSHDAAAAIYRCLPESEVGPELHVTTTDRSRDGLSGIVLHRVHEMHFRDVRTFAGVPITSPARMLLDVASMGDHDKLERAFDEAVFRKLVREPQLHELLRRASGRRGVRAFRALARKEFAGLRSRLAAERLCRRLLVKAGLTGFRPNAEIDGRYVDFLFAAERVIVEVDSYAHHGRRASFEADRARDAAHVALGYTVIRVTWRQLRDESATTIRRIATALQLRAPRAGFVVPHTSNRSRP